MSDAVVVRDLTKKFETVVALDSISFNVSDGELFGLVGPDGGGKTTLFRILTTLLVPDRGSASLLGMDVIKDMWSIRSAVGYMPGGFSLYPDLSVQENLEFFASVFGTTVAKGYELIAPIYKQIEPFKDRRADALSGGMKQKLALSCALVHRPKILLLDEPTTGVDAVSRREFWDQLGELKKSGLTIVVSTPYMDEAIRCDRVALIHNGHILEIDAPSVIGSRFDRPLFAVSGANRYALLQALRAFEHADSVQLFGESLHYTDKRAPRGGDTAGVSTNGERAQLRAPESASREAPQIANEVSAFLASKGFSDVTVQPVAASIEDSFMALMGKAA